MTAHQIYNLLRKWEWSTLQKVYGYGHNSIIGFISYNWIKEHNKNCVLDGAPSANKKAPHRYADAILCSGKSPKIAVEVETDVSLYLKKLDGLELYYNNPDETYLFNIFFMGNLKTKAINVGKHQWEPTKSKARKSKSAIALISLLKEKKSFSAEEKDRIFFKSVYSRWNIIGIECWIKDETGQELCKKLLLTFSV